MTLKSELFFYKWGFWAIPTPQRFCGYENPRQWWLSQLKFVKSIRPLHVRCGNLRTSRSNHKENSKASSRRRSWESDKKGVLILFDIKIRSVEKSILKVRHENITKMGKTKSTMTPLDMNLRIQITWRGNNYVHGLDWFWVRRLFRALMCRWMGGTVVPACLKEN